MFLSFLRGGYGRLTVARGFQETPRNSAKQIKYLVPPRLFFGAPKAPSNQRPHVENAKFNVLNLHRELENVKYRHRL